jgi:hypothetical protein
LCDLNRSTRLVYSQSPSQDRAAEIRADLDEMDAALRLQPAAIAESAAIFVAHVNTVLREQPVVNGLLGDISQAPTAARIDDIDKATSRKRRPPPVSTTSTTCSAAASAKARPWRSGTGSTSSCWRRPSGYCCCMWAPAWPAATR